MTESALSRLAKLGRYEDLTLLGEGGMGAVYRAHDPALDRIVAIKIVTINRAEYVARFRREARAIAKLSHSNIVQVYDFGEDEQGNPYFVMELLPGRSLEKVIAEKGPLPAELVADLLRQAADGLAAAHEVEIVHRDIKPANLVVDPQFKLKLVDFGIAHVEEGGDALTRPQSLMGTPSYMAPEMLRGEKVDGRADIYALGLTGFHLLAGRPPYEAPSSIALTVMQLSEPLPDLAALAPQTPRALVELIEKMAKKDRNERIQSAKEASAALAQFLAQPAATTAVPSAPSKPKWIFPAAAAVAVVAAGLCTGWALHGHKTTKTSEIPDGQAKIIKVANDPNGNTGIGANDPKTPPNTPPAVDDGPVRIAVLKFKNLGSDKSLDVLTEGIGETALTSLSGIANLTLVERNQVDQAIGEIDFGQTKYVDKSTAAALGSMKGVSLAVQGGYQKAGDQIRVSARVVRVATGEIIDVLSITRPAGDLFDVQDKVAAELKKHLVTLAQTK